MVAWIWGACLSRLRGGASERQGLRADRIRDPYGLGIGGMSSVLDPLVTAGVLHPYATDLLAPVLLAPVLLAVLAEASRAVSVKPELSAERSHLMLRMLGALRKD